MEFLLTFYITIYAICDNMGLFCPIGCFYCALKSYDCVPSSGKATQTSAAGALAPQGFTTVQKQRFVFPVEGQPRPSE